MDRGTRLKQHGRRLYALAWGIEGIAVLVGLSIAIVLGLDASSKSGGSLLSMDVILASGGFLIVACAELTKIPVATTLVHARWQWKPALLALLALMSVITFETIFFSLERGFTLRALEVEARRHVVESLEGERQALEADTARGLDTAAATDRLLLGAADGQRRPVLDRIGQLNAELDSLRTEAMPPAAADLDRRIANLESKAAALRDRRDAEKRERIDRFESQRDSYLERIEDARADGDAAYGQRMKDELARLPYPTRDLEAITARYDGEIARVDGDIDELRVRRNELMIAPAPATVERMAALRRQIDAARQELADLDRSSAILLDRRNQNGLDQAAAIAASEARLREIGTAMAAGRAELALHAELDQVHRVAAFWFDKPPAEVTSQEAKQVAAFWFGSIAALAALAGAATAILGECLLRLGDAADRSGRPSGLAGLLRRWMLQWRWRRVRTLERVVEKIVEGPPVDRIVEKIVERPFKQFVYVPILTDDPDAVRTALARDLPAEAAELLRASPWRDGYAGST